jgi:hypothetical protein
MPELHALFRIAAGASFCGERFCLQASGALAISSWDQRSDRFSSAHFGPARQGTLAHRTAKAAGFGRVRIVPNRSRETKQSSSLCDMTKRRTHFKPGKRRRAEEDRERAAAAVEAAGAASDGDTAMSEQEEEDAEARRPVKVRSIMRRGQRATVAVDRLQQRCDEQAQELRLLKRQLASSVRQQRTDAVQIDALAADLAESDSRRLDLEAAEAEAEAVAAAAARTHRSASSSAYSNDERRAMMTMHEAGASQQAIRAAFSAFDERTPSRRTIGRTLLEGGVLGLLQSGEAMQQSGNVTLGHDGSTKRTEHLEALTCTVPSDDGGLVSLAVGLSGTPGGRAADSSERVQAMLADADRLQSALAQYKHMPEPVRLLPMKKSLPHTALTACWCILRSRPRSLA